MAGFSVFGLFSSGIFIYDPVRLNTGLRYLEPDGRAEHFDKVGLLLTISCFVLLAGLIAIRLRLQNMSLELDSGA